MKHFVFLLLLSVGCGAGLLNAAEVPPLRILDFQADNGFAHDSKATALALVETLGKKNGWEVVTTVDAARGPAHPLRSGTDQGGVAKSAKKSPGASGSS